MNINVMMRKVQEMQAKMADMQNSLDSVDITGQSGGGMVVVQANGKAELRKITIDPQLINPAEKDLLEDLIVAAVNDAKKRAEEHIAGETQQIMGDMGLPPGMKLPF
ncbi:MAG: YbaB/EbfC family nucleoid-associated protein [Alphaproteobacteria bacterium]|nr:YbaB/EbfC family nucleoid-associated protein [Alphaproteobacteria bacterium]MBV8548438.1 YbaB/EbfC family nucleoid-associated protein [Alphaproteobacteria bacterium]